MKTTICILCLLLATSSVLSQNNQVAGEYIINLIENSKHKIEYKLTLEEDGRFFFHSYSFNKQGLPQVTQLYGRGNWSLKGTIVSFVTDVKEKIDDKYTMDFSNTRARFITKPVRDKTDRIIKTRLIFFQSEIHWVKGIEMFKR